MELGLKDRVALVTGTGSQIGIGKAIALTLAGEGCHVICNDIILEDARLTAAEVEKKGVKALAIKADITRGAEVAEMVKTALQHFGKIDILINNAGGAVNRGPFIQQKESDWDRDISLNLKGAMLCAHAVLPGMQERGYGKIINISSATGKHGSPSFEAYGSCKAGLFGFTKSLALALATSGINVNCVAPGFVDTNFGGRQPQADFLDTVEKVVPLKKATLPQDIANMAVFLASDVSANIIGQVYSVDGGFTMT